MRRVRVGLILVLLWVMSLGTRPARAGDPYLAYAPIVLEGDAMAGNWHVVVPAATTNLVTNPSVETGTTGWTAASGSMTQSSSEARWGAYSLYQDGYDALYATISPAGSDVTFSAWVKVVKNTTSQALAISIRDSGGTPIEAYTLTSADQDGEWHRVEVTCSSGTPARVYLGATGADAGGSPEIYWDGMQAEESAYATTYCDGDQPGCEWNGTQHGSTSTRSAQSRAGGRVRNFGDYSFYPTQMSGVGMPPTRSLVNQYALLPGGEVQGHKTGVRTFVLTGLLEGASYSDLHDKRQALVDLFAPSGKPGAQPVRLRYDGATVEKEIAVYYDGGLEMALTGAEGYTEVVGIRLLAADPFWYGVGESYAVLDENDTDANMRSVAARLRSTGQWSTLGPPDASGTYTAVRAIEVTRERTVFVGGDFENFDNVAAADYIAQYNPSTGTWSAVGSGLDDQVYAIRQLPNGHIYIGGAFNDASGHLDRIVRWDGTDYNALGTPMTGAGYFTAVYDMAFSSNGDLYVVGAFTTIDGETNASYIARWNGTWHAVGAPTAGSASVSGIAAIAIDSQDNIYVGGDFTTFANVTGADYIAMWDGSSWNAVVQLNAYVAALAVDKRDNVYLTGSFTNAGGEANADRIAMWNGQAMSALGTGLNVAASALSIGPDGILYAVGGFTSAGGMTVSGAAKWNGASWAHVDNTHAVSSPSAVALGPVDPVVATNYDIWEGWTSTGTLNYAGLTTVTNGGTEEAYPRIVVTRSGGTSATLYSIRNETTGKELLFAYGLLDGETLTIDLRPEKKSITSSVFGERMDALLANSDFADWALQPGDNSVTVFVDEAGTPTVTAYMVWRDVYASAD